MLQRTISRIAMSLTTARYSQPGERDPFAYPMHEADAGWTDESQDDDEPGSSVALVMPFVAFAMSP
jgi:hypothetical protein